MNVTLASRSMLIKCHAQVSCKSFASEHYIIDIFDLIDIDECAAETDNCDQVCTNDDGSYVCSCNSGFTLASDGLTCLDIDECMSGANNCEQLCIDTDGSFRCECNPGFQLNSDQATCSGKLTIIKSINY